MMDQVNILAWMPGYGELIVVALFGLLIFGKRLPEVGKSLGKSIVEFKKGLKGIEEEIDSATDQRDMLPPPDATATNSADTSETASAPDPVTNAKSGESSD